MENDYAKLNLRDYDKFSERERLFEKHSLHESRIKELIGLEKKIDAHRLDGLCIAIGRTNWGDYETYYIPINEATNKIHDQHEELTKKSRKENQSDQKNVYLAIHKMETKMSFKEPFKDWLNRRKKKEMQKEIDATNKAMKDIADGIIRAMIRTRDF